MPAVNPGPATTQNPNTQAPMSYEKLLQTIAVNMTPTALTASTTTTESFGLNGATQATAATGIQPGDVIISVSYSGAQTAGVTSPNGYVDPAVQDKFYVIFNNATAGTPTPASGYYLVTVARYSTSAGSATPATFANLPSSLF